MKTGWKITIEAVAFEPAMARLFADRVTRFTGTVDASVSGLDGSASIKWEKIELPDVDEGENL